MRFFVVCTALLALLVAACGGEPATPDASLPPPRITRLDAPSPSLAGTLIRVTGVDLDRLGDNPTLDGRDGGTPLFTLSKAPSDERDALLFRLTRQAIDALGEGTHSITFVAAGRGVETEPFTAELTFASDLPLALDEGLGGSVHRNDVVVLHGDGFIASGEGSLSLHVVGEHRTDRGATVPVDVQLPVSLVDRADRTRGVVVLTTELGGARPGSLTGTAQLERTLASGSVAMSATLDVDLSFGAPELYAFDGTRVSIGRLVTVRGAGFLGGADRPSETTVLRLAGTFTPRDGAPRDASGELVPRFVAGGTVEVVIETDVVEGQVVSSYFGAQRGTFEGTATPVAIAGVDEVEGASTPITLVLGAPVQVVELRFLPGYYDTLARFGLAVAESEVADAIERRIEDIYAGVNVDVRLEAVTDFDATATTVVEIGGPDPNGNGLFGYDNSAGKDVGNLRMFDAIGGANAETQADGFPGFGGVFVESMLYWSTHPDLPGAAPVSVPEPEPLFDELFDPVRLEPATRDEVDGLGDSARVEAVARAIDALAAIIGETTAHELGHSLGMAQPTGPVTAFHREGDGDGCVMDGGNARPLGERAAQPGFARSVFCDDEPGYLVSILGGD